MKKLLVLFLVCAMFAMAFTPIAKASTMDGLMAQIVSLQKQVATLQSQVSALALSAVSKVVVPVTKTIIPASAPAVEKEIVPATVTNLPVTTNVVPKTIENPVVEKEIVPRVVNSNVYMPDTAVPNITVTKLTIGSTGADVLSLQNALVAKGFLVGTADGKYGKGTAAAVTKFQLSNGLKGDGVAGEKTLNLIGISRPSGPIIARVCLPTTPAWIQVLSPNGGETYTAGQNVTVKWKSCNILSSALINVCLQNLSGTDCLISSNNDGTETVTLPTQNDWPQMVYGNNFKVLLAGAVVAAMDFSDNLFTINPVVVSGSIIVADANNSRIQEFDSNGNYLAKIEDAGSGNGQFYYPSRIAVAPNHNIYVVDSCGANCIQEFTPSGTFITQWTFTGATAIAIAPNGNVYVTNIANNSIQEFTSNGTPITQWGTTGSGNGQFVTPMGIAIAPNGNVYVTDASNNRIQEFTSSGTYITQWGVQGSGNGQLGNPMGIAVAPNGNVYVVDLFNNRIQEFTSSGTYVTQWTYDSGYFYPYDIAVAPNGNVYVVDTSGPNNYHNNDRIVEFTSNGTYVNQWGGHGSNNGQFNNPTGIAIVN